tara:strand:+ start:859 stop:2070 length:1212 start_codon:yes stop_codon:yes gene_type:complete
MKIIIFTEISRSGGVDTFIANLINNWPSDDDSFILVSNRSHPGLVNIEKNLIKNCKIIKHGIPLNWNFLSRYIMYLPLIIQRLLRQFFRIILSPIQYFLLKRLLKNMEADFMISVNGGYPGGETCRLANIAWGALKISSSIHNIHNLAGKSRKITSLYENFIDKKLEESAGKIITVSNHCSKSLSVRPVFVKSSKIMHIHNGLEKLKNNREFLGKKISLSANDKVIMMIGTYEKHKGHEFLMRAMVDVYKKHPDVHLVIIGSGSRIEKKGIQDLIEKYNPSKNIHLLGFVADASRLIKEADLFVIPSQSDESFGLTAVEAMLHRVPIISTDIGALPETMGDNGHCGYYSSPKKPEIFADNICTLIKDEEKSIKLGINGEKRARERYTPKKMSKDYYDVIQRLT